ncbi:hypothetical protein ONS95_014258 [Cadophora gregata]|uniref:uncharacterized protein n=1 Tax=Cadophora gregata TaxID=51156 RepID=UPI0026DA7902|nr:uncharacterized protein ONS95_014258 [Cadophora gregata]KAK0114775.1 hypothetical protein ONS95_014258 [Cadophora gregata]
MASTTFSPVNTNLASDPHGRNGEEANPLTPRPSTAPSSQLHPQMPRDDARTPTRATFGLDNQRPLPPASSPFVPPTPSSSNEEQSQQTGLTRGDSQHSTKSGDSADVDMDSEDNGEEGSEDDASVNADGTRSTKKKGKSQRFYCLDYPPCNLSFTRSEHLARHIRKHTGERPFQCHCSRRFSRLDNLRQHAQTVHQNEDIPPESLAATGTRFQRQVRTDRVRPAGRSRASTASSQGSQGRGHQRNSLSLSSMTSIGSAGSIYPNRDDVRRRPPPLVMADGRNRFSQEIYRPDSPSSGYYRQDSYRPQSPGFSTPTSATFSTGQNSPHWASGMQSPGSTHSRTASLYSGHRTPGRRLSVPSAGNPFQSPHGNNFGPSTLGLNSSNAGAFSPSTSMISSPTTSTSGWSRRESINSVDYENRRRTWHPETRPGMEHFTSRLQNVTTPSHYATGPGPLPQPPIVPSQPMRLPGIESFDPVPRPTTPVQRQPSPMMIDTPSRPPMNYDRERPISQHWEQGINRNMNRLDITQGTPPTDAASQWANDANRAVQSAREQVRQQPAVRFEESSYSARPQTSSGYPQHQHHVSAPVAPVTPRESKRQGWYHGPPNTQQNLQQPVQRTSPAESSGSEGGIPGTPSSSMGEYNPSIVHANGWVENRNGLQQHDPRNGPTNGYTNYPPQNGAEAAYTYGPGAHQNQVQQNDQVPKSNSNMNRLEALVAVATAADAKEVTAAY